MKRQKALAGYTIIEVMLFLIISSALLTSAMAIISGQQQRTQFATGLREFESKLQDIINDVEVGFFPSGNDVVCSVPGMETNTDAAPVLSVATSEQGTSQECMYMGKAIQFFKGAEGVTDSYRVITVAGKRLDFNNTSFKAEEPSSIEATAPRAFYVPDSFTGIEEGRTPYGLEVTKVRYVTSFNPLSTDDSNEQLAVVPSIALRETNNTVSNVGGGRVSLAVLNGDSNFSNNIAALTGSIPTLSDARVEQARLGGIICLRDGAGGRVAAVTLGVQLVANDSGAFEAQPSGRQLTPQGFVDDEASALGCTS